MKRFSLVLVIASVVGAASGWTAGYLRAHSEYVSAKKAETPDPYEYLRQPAAGRIEYVSADVLVANPAKYEGARIILAGRWITGFEVSSLDLQTTPDALPIWLDLDWAKLREPMGDFSPKDVREVGWHFEGRSAQLVAEGTFHYHKRGFGHLSAYDGFFLVDRLLACEPCETNSPTPR